VSQGNKWCDFCKIYIANNPLSIRTHEIGKRHKDNVTKRLATMQKEGAAKEKEQQQAARALKQIEAKAKKSYQKDLENSQRNVDGDTSAAPGDGVYGSPLSINSVLQCLIHCIACFLLCH
jgi:WW domain-binding protein 4